MAKYGNEFYLQVSRALFQEPYCRLSISAKWLYVTLKELEHRYTGPENDYFWRTNEELARDAGISVNTLKRAKEELFDSGLIEIWQAHFIDQETRKKSTKHVSTYRILK